METLVDIEESCNKIISVLLALYIGLHTKKIRDSNNREFMSALDMVFSQHLKTGLAKGLDLDELEQLFRKMKLRTVDQFILGINTKQNLR